MVNLDDPSEFQRADWILAKVWHCIAGLYFWEFVTTLDYELGVIRGHIPYRWTIWIYSLTRIASLLGVMLSLVGMDVTGPIDCQVWISFVATFVYISAAAASLLIVLRIIAIWNGNKVITAVAISIWGVNIISLIQGVMQFRSTRVPVPPTCVVVNDESSMITLIAMVVTDIALLLIMLARLLHLRCHGGGTFGITQLLWKQGVCWLLLATAAGVPPIVVLKVLHLNDRLNSIFQAPSLITMTIAATRMHRSLVDFSSRSFEVTNGNHQTSGLTFSKAKPAHAISTPFRRTEISVDVVFEQHATPQMSHHDSCANTDEEVHREPSGSGLDQA